MSETNVAVVCTTSQKMQEWKMYILKTIGNSIVRGGSKVWDRDLNVMYHFYFDTDPDKLRGTLFQFAVYDTEGSPMVCRNTEDALEVSTYLNNGKLWVIS